VNVKILDLCESISKTGSRWIIKESQGRSQSQQAKLSPANVSSSVPIMLAESRVGAGAGEEVAIVFLSIMIRKEI
jgi:hypothetical protein